MAVMWTKFYETSTDGDMPTTSANTWSQGFTAQNGTLEFLTLRYSLIFADNPVTDSDISSIISSVRVIVNGSVQHDFIAGFASNANAQASQYSYALNKMGGRAVEVADDSDPTIRTGFINIPLGAVLNSQGQNRIECIVGWAATGAGATPEESSCKLEWWGRYNDGTQTGQILGSSTTFQHSLNAQEQVIVRCPTLLPSGAKISGLLVLNDDGSDNMRTQGLRINALSNFGLTPDQWRMINGDLMNGVEFNAGSTLDSLSYLQGVDGSLLIPLFDLTLGDISITVDNGLATTRRYFPVITYPVGGKAMNEQRQTQRVVASSSKAILSNDLQ